MRHHVKPLPTALGERLDLDLEVMSGNTADDFSTEINPRNLPAISIDMDSLGGRDAQLTPADLAATTQQVVLSLGA
ncbi:hypothetical protein PVAP13_6NG090006 [Panicum virgatum]|uniref:Uncharacterized protein n=1 Tax=Panicum virgatum TaxID=38727 RepID=A0A8T0QVQ3_PANVG|nr:hypothetical protein PVAP13_6NG090006 [Panicum virgatum]